MSPATAAEPEVNSKDSADDLFAIDDENTSDSDETVTATKDELQNVNFSDDEEEEINAAIHTKRAQSSSERNNNGTRLAAIAQETSAAEGGVLVVENHNEEDDDDEYKEKEAPVTWMSLPHKRQLVILTLARLSEPLVQTSLQSYMFYQLKSFDESLSDAVISTQAGMLASSFTGAQFLTAMMWGRISDSEWAGRKMVLMIGLVGTMLSCLGFGFSKTFWQAMLFRTAGGALNGNVGVMRTMVSEIIQEKKYQSRAFLIFPMTYNIGVIIGPILGGLLANPAASYPRLFGGIRFFEVFPYAPPNILSAVFLTLASCLVFFGLEETLQSIRHREDIGTMCFRKIRQLFAICRGRGRRQPHSIPFHAYAPVSSEDELTSSTPGFSTRAIDDDNNVTSQSQQLDVEMTSPMTATYQNQPHLESPPARFRTRLPFRRIFTRNVINTYIAHILLATHIGTFQSLWFVFLSTPVEDPSSSSSSSSSTTTARAHIQTNTHPHKLPFHFTGGLGMAPRTVGFAMAFLGLIGISMQLFVYPRVTNRLGVLKSWHIFLFCFPLSYILVPYLSIVPSRSPPPAEKDGSLIWLALGCVLFIQVTCRTFALPAMTILVNNCSPHPSVLGTIHGIGQSVSSAGRTIGPTIGGWLYGYGLSHGIVGLVFWCLSGVAIVNCVASWWVFEGDGHEIWLEGDREAERRWWEWQRWRKREKEKQRLRLEAEAEAGVGR